MPAKPQIEEVESRRGFRCHASISFGNQVWRGLTWVSKLESISLEGHGQPVPTFGEGSVVTLHLDSAVLGQMTAVAKITSLTIHSRASSGASASVQAEPVRQDDISCAAFRIRMAELKPLVLFIGAEERVQEEDSAGFRVKEAQTQSEASRLLEDDAAAVVVFGPSIKPLEVRDLLQSRCQGALPRSMHIVLYEEAPPSAFQDLVDEDAIFYLTHVSIAAQELRALVISALRQYAQKEEPPVSTQLTVEDLERLTEMCSRLARKSDIPNFLCALSEELKVFLQATSARCLFYDRRTDTLCAKGAEDGELEPISAVAGLLGYVARTGERVKIEQVGKDSRYDSEADNPAGRPESHFIAQPLSGTRGATIGVLTAIREAHLSPFTTEDENRIELLAGRVAPLLRVLLADTQPPQTSDPADETDRNLFRKEALDYENEGEQEGKLLWSIPLWLTWSHFLIVVFLIISVAYVMLAKVHQVVTGPAVIQVMNRTAVPALNSGVVATLLVAPSERVTEGELLATLRSSPGDSLLARMREEVRAPVDGVVSGINIRVGQTVTSGEQVLSLSREGSSNEVLAFLPGSYAPQILHGMPLILKIDGYPQSREELTILEVAPDIIGPSDAERYVGKEIAQTLSLSGAVLMVRAALPLDTFDMFETEHERLHYQDGMMAHAEVSVREEPLIVSLVPGLKQIYGSSRITFGHIWNTPRRP